MASGDSPEPSGEAVSWGAFAADVPEFAAEVQSRFEAHPHHVIATLRADGRPRVSGTNVGFDGDRLWLGTMDHSMKAADLLRDPRCAVHSAPLDEELARGSGDATVDAVAARLGDDDSTRLLREEFGEDASLDGQLWELWIRTVSVIEVQGDQLRVRFWTPRGGLTEVLRD